MGDMPDSDDDRMVSLLGDVLDDIEGAPVTSVDFAVGLFALRHFGNEVMQLIEDSQMAGLASRSDGSTRVLAFSVPACRLELDIDADEQVMVGEVDPPGLESLRLLSQGGVTVVDVDPLGRFRIRIDAIVGPCRFVVEHVDSTTVSTPVFTL